MSIRAEAMMEEVTAHLYRNSLDEAHQVRLAHS